MDPTKNENAVLPLVTRSKSAVNWPVDVIKVLRMKDRARAGLIREAVGEVDTGVDFHGCLDKAKEIVALDEVLNEILNDISLRIDEDSRMIEKLNTEREELVRKTETLGVLATETELVKLLDEYSPTNIVKFAKLGQQWDEANQDERDMDTVLTALGENGIEGYELDDHINARSPEELDKLKTCLAKIAEELGKVDFEE